MNDKVNILIMDTGGRGHALLWKYTESKYAGNIYSLGPLGIEKNTRKGQAESIRTVPELKREIAENPLAIKKFCEEKNIGFVDIGAEDYLARGFVDILTEAGIPAIGPTKDYAKIENDREFTNDILEKIGAKPEWTVFDPGPDATETDRINTAERAKEYVRSIGYQVVVKAGGLAQGKGCIVCSNPAEAEAAVDRIIRDREFKDYGANSLKAIIEARKYGTEISFYTYLDGKTHLPMKMLAQDYKAAYDADDYSSRFYYNYRRNVSGIIDGLRQNNIELAFDRHDWMTLLHEKSLSALERKKITIQDNNIMKIADREVKPFIETISAENQLDNLINFLLRGKNVTMINPNTGGTGSYCPHKLMGQGWIMNNILEKVVNPFVGELYDRGMNYKGVLYFGMNLSPDNTISVFEVNVRHGDPEWEVIARKLNTNIFDITRAVWDGKLDELKRSLPNSEIDWNPRHYVDVVAMSGAAKGKKGWKLGYPARYPIYSEIRGLDKIDDDGSVIVFFAGTNVSETGNLISDGGRVLHVVAGADTLEDATDKAYNNVERLEFITSNGTNGLRYRKTLGAREIV